MRIADTPSSGAAPKSLARPPGQPQGGTPQKGPDITDWSASSPELAERNGNPLWEARDATIKFWDESSLPLEEQELTINILRQPEPEDYAVDICCSHGPFLTKIKRLRNFRVRELLVNHEGRILQARGALPEAAISLRGSAWWRERKR